MLTGLAPLLPVLVLASGLLVKSINCTLGGKSALRSTLVEPVFSYDDYGIHQDATKGKQTPTAQPAEVKGGGQAEGGAQRIKSIVLSSLPYTSSQLYRSPFALMELAEEPRKEEPHHWSALNNYYQKLRYSTHQQPASSISLLRPPFEQQRIALEPSIMDYWRLQQETIDSPLEQSKRPFKLLPAPAAYYPPALKLVPAGSRPEDQKQLMLPPLVEPGFDKITQQKLLANHDQQHQQQQLLYPIQQHQDQQQLLLTSGYEYPSSYNRPPVAWADLVQRPLGKLLMENGRPAESSWRDRLPELLLLRQLQEQQMRAKHQLATFGNWYDYQRTRELLQEEAYCGPRNHPWLHSGASKTATASAAAGGLAPNEYPSHVGIYNQTNYLCAGTWVSEEYVLTIASCVSGLEPGQLEVRFNEWNSHHHQDSNMTKLWATLPLPKPAPVDQVHLFPKFREAREHNLALLRLAAPVNYLESAYVVPACQAQARSLLRASNCWAPVRNLTRVEYFDPTGDGETREKLVVSMLERPVKLVVRDEQECKRSTGSELFNFQHPNFICSADLKRSDWRLKLNTTDAFGSGVYCEEAGRLTLVSLLHPMRLDQPSSSGYLDLTYYRPWMSNIMSARP